MLKYKNIATVGVSVDLHNNYSIIAFANWNKELNLYESSLYIKRDDIDILELIESCERIQLENSDSKSIRTDIATWITDLNNKKFFDYYINRFEYEQVCSYKGFEFVEKERLCRDV